jgi:hypothetical protein
MTRRKHWYAQTPWALLLQLAQIPLVKPLQTAHHITALQPPAQKLSVSAEHAGPFTDAHPQAIAKPQTLPLPTPATMASALLGKKLATQLKNV